MLRLTSFFIVGAASLTPTELDSLWSEFRTHFQRSYKDDVEEALRRGYFNENMERAESMNEQDGNWVPYGHLSPLADWSPTEFKRRNALKADRILEQLKQSPKIVSESTVPDAFDWREEGAVNEVKDQGQCGSCWSFATVANIEGVNFHENKELVSLSEQQLVDCDNSDNGCDGGLPEQADKWLIAQHVGLESEKDYPYEGVAGECRQKEKRERIFVGQFIHVPNSEDDMALALMKYGPLSIGINAKLMQLYMGGIAHPTKEECDPEQLDHGVVLVAFGSADTPDDPQKVKKQLEGQYLLKAQGLIKKNPEIDWAKTGGELLKSSGKKTKFWTIRNSWGSSWGEQGYYRIIRGTGACGLNQLVTTATEVTKKAVPEDETVVYV